MGFGFWVETKGRRREQTKYLHWCNFRDRLKADEGFQGQLEQALMVHDLILGDYYHRDTAGGALKGLYRGKKGKIEWLPAGKTTWRKARFDELVDHVTTLDTDDWINVHVFAEVDRGAAISMGRQVLDPIICVLEALAPIYRTVIRPIAP